MGVTRFLVGDQPRPFDLVAATVTGVAFALLVAFHADVRTWQAIALALLAGDIGAGLVSNATEATRRAWQEYATSRQRTAFLVSHLTVYPTAIWFLSGGAHGLAGFLTLLLLAKVTLFWSGQRKP